MEPGSASPCRHSRPPSPFTTATAPPACLRTYYKRSETSSARTPTNVSTNPVANSSTPIGQVEVAASPPPPTTPDLQHLLCGKSAGCPSLPRRAVGSRFRDLGRLPPILDGESNQN